VNSDILVAALRLSRLGTLPWQGGALDERVDRFRPLDQSEEQSLAFNFATSKPSSVSSYLDRFLTSNQKTYDLGFPHSDDARDQKPVIFISYAHHMLPIDQDSIVGTQLARQASALQRISPETVFCFGENVLRADRNADLSRDWSKIQSATAPPESRQVLSQESLEVWEEEDDARFDLLVEKELSGKLISTEREELEMLNQKRDRTLARVSNEEMERENLKEAALTELQNLIDKYAPLFDKRT
jgi:hypothetical protein